MPPIYPLVEKGKHTHIMHSDTSTPQDLEKVKLLFPNFTHRQKRKHNTNVMHFETQASKTTIYIMERHKDNDTTNVDYFE
jgi:hypothetical protein